MDTSWSIPICVELSMYTGFYTVSELVFRYILLLIVLYVISETRSCPLALQIILVTMVNPLIFT